MRCRVSIQCDGLRRRSLTFDRLPEERFGRSDIAPGTETKIHCSAVSIDRTVEIHPFAADLDIRLIDAPRRPDRPREPVPAPLKLRRIMVHPAHDCGVNQRQTTLR